MDKKKRELLDRRQMMALGTAGLLLAVFVAVIYVPKSSQLSGLRAEITKSKQELAALTDRATETPLVAAEIEKQLVEHQRNLRRLPRQASLPEFLHEVSSILAEEETARRVLQEGSGRIQNGYIESPITIAFDSTFVGVYRTLSRIEQLPRLSRIDSVRLVSVADQPGLVRVELKLVVFHIDENSGAASSKGKVSA